MLDTPVIPALGGAVVWSQCGLYIARLSINWEPGMELCAGALEREFDPNTRAARALVN